MTDPKYKHAHGKLLYLVMLKKKAMEELSRNVGFSAEEIFYRFMKSELPERGSFEDGTVYFYHGMGCSIKNELEGWETELEFGPRGQYHAFDKYTLCHELGFTVGECESVISELESDGIILLADAEFFELTKRQPRNIRWESEEDDIDACVADRYVVWSHARINAAKYIAQEIVDGKLSPGEGALKIWLDILDSGDYPEDLEELDVFVGLADEYDDFGDEVHIEFYGVDGCAEQRKKTEESIVEEARILLGDKKRRITRTILYSGVDRDNKPKNGYVEAENNREALQILKKEGVSDIRLHDDGLYASYRNELEDLSDKELERTAQFEIECRYNLNIFGFLKEVLRKNIFILLAGAGVIAWGIYSNSTIIILVGILLMLSMPVFSLWNYRHVNNYNRLQIELAWGNWQEALRLIDKLRVHMKESEVAFDLDINEACIVARERSLEEALKIVDMWREVFSETSPSLYESRISSMYHYCGDYDGFVECMRSAYLKSPENSLVTLDMALAEARFGSVEKASALLEKVHKEELPRFALLAVSWVKGLVARTNKDLAAKDYLESAVLQISAYSKNPVMWKHIALCTGAYALALHDSDEKQKAEELLEKIWKVLKVHGDNILLKEIGEKFPDYAV